MRYKKSFREKASTATIYLINILLTMAFLYPVVYCVSVSLSDPVELGGKPIYLLPRGFSLDAYRYLLSSNAVFRYYANTILYAGLGTLITVLCTGLVAYTLSGPKFGARKFITVYLTITMFFGGGMVPTYLLMGDLHLINTVWVMVLPGAVGAYNVMVYKTFFKGIPESLKDAAKVDGAGHWRIFFTLMIPLSKPLLATMTLFSVVSHWNGYLNAVIYLRDTDKHPIQMLLRKLLITLELSESELGSLGNLAVELETNTRTVKCAAAVIAMLPILSVYPFAQKYFAKGVMIGSIKE